MVHQKSGQGLARLLLADAKFNTHACQSCPNNTSVQGGLFSGGDEPPECLNAACFQEKSTTAQSAPQAQPLEATNRVKEYRVKVWRRAATRAALVSEEVSRDLLIGLALLGLTRHIKQAAVCDGMERIGAGVFRSYDKLASKGAALKGASDYGKRRLLKAMPASAIEDIPETNLVDCLQFLNVNLAEHWVLDEQFLGLLTKAEIQAVAWEIGVAEHIGSDALARLASGKKEALISGLLKAEGFQFAGLIPACMQWPLTPSQTPAASCEEEGCEEGSEEEALET